MKSVPETLGAVRLEDGSARFLLWAPRSRRVELRIVAPAERRVPMEPLDRGYHAARVERVPQGASYLFRLDGGEELPDPASRLQPLGVHGPSEVIDMSFPWTDDAWRGIPLEEYVIYELHVGTYTPEGTLEAIVPLLDGLRDLGVTALELMPLAQFPGSRNWGYDGVFPFAAQSAYGGPAALARLVDACHRRGLALVLDVVYNHLGPEGNRFGKFGSYFTDRYRTPWGAAINFDGPDSDEVRRYFVENALYWVRDLHVDALRLDALHAIHDDTARPFLEELADAVHGFAESRGRRVWLIAESDLNAPRLIEPPDRGGYGLDAQWSDDFHHALHGLVTGERSGYYEDFGELRHLEKAFRAGYVYTGERSAHRKRRHGRPPVRCAPRQLVVCAQNHDQVGNRMLGDRLSTLVPLEDRKLAAAAVILSPYLPLLFMGEEYGETAPFQYFVSHSDPDLVEAVRSGRREEFASFAWQGEAPDPQSEETFLRSKLRHELRSEEPHRTILEFHAECLRLRRSIPALSRLEREGIRVTAREEARVLWVHRRAGASEALLALRFGTAGSSDAGAPSAGTPSVEPRSPYPPPSHGSPVEAAPVEAPLAEGRWRKELDSADPRWAGPGSPAPETLDLGLRRAVRLPTSAAVLYLRADGEDAGRGASG